MTIFALSFTAIICAIVALLALFFVIVCVYMLATAKSEFSKILWAIFTGLVTLAAAVAGMITCAGYIVRAVVS